MITPNKDKINGKYLNAFIHSDYIRKYFENSASGSGQRYSLSVQTLEDMPILLPSIEKQQHIGKILSDIDRKIALNKAINHNLVVSHHVHFTLPLLDHSLEEVVARLAA